MAMAQWTSAQEAAFSARGKDMLVSAGAGSGKTAVLVERAVSLFGEGLEPRKLLVVTFTRAAAREMKERILSELSRRARSGSDAAALQQEAAERLDEAQISTIHSFCLSIVQRYAYIAGMDPSSSLLSDAEEKMLKAECLEEVFEEAYSAGSESFVRLVDAFSAGGKEDALMESALSIYSFALNRISPDEWLDSALSAYATGEAFKNGVLEEALLSRCREAAEAALFAIGNAQEILSGERDPKREAYFEAMMRQASSVALSLSEGFEAFLGEISDWKAARYDMRGPHSSKEELARLQKKAKAAMDGLKKTFGFRFSTYMRSLEAAREDAAEFVRVVRAFRARYQAKKAARASIDYSDLEHGCLAVLKDEGARKEIASSFSEIMVDEYQDTNEIQEAIVTLVSTPGRLFFVGDMKQSIYRFREAAPAIFSRRYRAYREGEEGSLAILNQNFRSAKSVIEAINQIFDPIFLESTGGTDYWPDERLEPSEFAQEGPAAELHVALIPGKEERDEEGEAEAANDWEGRLIASIVSDLIESGRTVFDRQTGFPRPVRFSDIAVLARSVSNTHSSYESALTQRGIPYASDFSGSFYDETEVSLALSLLKVVDNELDDIALLSVMRSFAYRFTESELLLIRSSYPEERFFHKAAQMYAVEGEDEGLREKTASLYADVDALRAHAMGSSLASLVKAAYERTGLRSLASALPGADARLRNLDYLSSLSSAYEKSSFKGLSHFLKYAETRRKADAESRRASEGHGGDAVKILSVHKSKGLEFEFVIVAGAGRRFNQTASRRKAVCEKRLGLACDYIDLERMFYTDTLLSLAAKAAIRSEETAEEMRLFYVAMTRARTGLYVTAALRKSPFESAPAGGASPYEIMQAKCYLDWMLMSLGQGADFGEGGFSCGAWRAYLRRPPFGAGNFRFMEPAAEEASFDWEKMKEILSFSYPYALSLKVPSKVTVTRLSRAQGEVLGEARAAFAEGPRFLEDGGAGAPSAAARGVLAHEALQAIRLEALRGTGDMLQAVKGELEGMSAYKDVDPRPIARFFSSPLGQKMLKAEWVEREAEFFLSMRAEELSEEWAGAEEDVIVQGVIDCVFESEGETYVLDWKTDRPRSEGLFEEALSKYRRQISLYVTALSERWGKKPDHAAIVFLSLDRIVEMV
jgi:ATP-dependent helicase/nuclease subunit A